MRADAPRLFSPVAIGSVELPNRIVVSPMCQYSASDGCANAWHQMHLGSLAISGAGLLFVEATAVTPSGRITPGCLGIYDDASRLAQHELVRSIRAVSNIPLAMQIGHAGRKASSAVPWQGGQLLDAADGGWQTVAPSALAQHPDEVPPQAMSAADIVALIDDFVSAARAAHEAGYDLLELHFAHGYLIHQFLSPLANNRTDEFGGSLENRMRLAQQIFLAVHEEVGGDLPVGVRLSATDWVAQGWDIDQSLQLCQALDQSGCAFFDVSSGGLSPAQQIPLAPGYQVAFARQIRQAVSAPVMAVGLITEPEQAEAIVANGEADMVAMARAFLFDPRWPWRAAAALGATVVPPSQYSRCLPAGAAPVFGNSRVGQR
jgi:2,4-dienoyl-CoA reductase-like NADH-dependent reductase (Old Yellow Enzyme family)